MVNNHALGDGNKRLGWLATVVFPDLNELLVATASGSATLARIADALERWAQG